MARALYPAFLDLSHALCLVIGGGKVAQRKIEGLVEGGAKRIRLISPTATAAARSLADQGEVEWLRRKAEVRDLDEVAAHPGTKIVFLCTSSGPFQREMAAACAERALLVNVADGPAESTFLVGSVVRRGAIQVAISTGGESPMLASNLREKVEQSLDPSYEALCQLLGEVRQEDMRKKLPVLLRHARMKRILQPDILQLLRDEPEAAPAKVRKILDGVLPE